jgi:two-component system LytT family sensor kinase
MIGRRQARWLLTVAAIWTLVGLLRGAVQAGLANTRPVDRVLIFFLITAWFWVPATLVISYLWRRYPLERGRLGPALLAHGIALTAIIFAEPYCFILTRQLMGGRPWSYPLFLINRLDTNILGYLAILGTLWALDYHHRHIASRIAAARLDRALADAQLHVLTMQLHPHFLFNTLHLVSQLVFEDLRAARQVLADLRSLLAESFTHAARREVALPDELRFLEAYLSIQRQRFQGRLTATVHVEPEALEARIPHLILQPLVENALRHGIEPRAEGGTVTVRIARKGDRMLVQVQDDGVGLAAAGARMRTGLGVANTQLRLRYLYGDDFHFSLTAAPGGGTVATIVMPMRPPEERPESAHVLADVDTIEREARARVAPREHTPLAVVDAVPILADDPDLSGEVMEVAAVNESRTRARGAMIVLGAWIVVAGVWTIVETMSSWVVHQPPAWNLMLVQNTIIAASWVLLTPVVLHLAVRYRIAAGTARRRIALHLAIAPFIATLHLLGVWVIVHLFAPDIGNTVRNIASSWFVWDLGVYLILVSASHAREFAAWYRDSVTESARTRAELARARVQTLRLQLQPSLMLSALDAIAEMAGEDAERCERIITRAGDMLRGLLATAAREEIPLREELALLEAYLDVDGVRHGIIGRTLRIDPRALETRVPPMLLQPLVEWLAAGALRANLATLEITGIIDHAALRIELAARGAAAGGVVRGAESSSLAQLRSRLTELYGPAYALELTATSGERSVRLSLPVHRQPAETVAEVEPLEVITA